MITKRTLFFLHSWLGLLAGLGLLLIGLSGSVIVFREEIDAALNPERVLVPDPSLPRLGAQDFHDRVAAQFPEHEIRGWGPNRNPAYASTVYLMGKTVGEEKKVYADPTTGQAQGGLMDWDGTFLSWLVSFHFTFGVDHFGMIAAGLCAVILLLLAVTGVWINQPFWKSFIRLRWRAAGRIVFSDAHKMIGVTNTLFFLIFGITGAWWNITHVYHHLAEGAFFDEKIEPAARFWKEGLDLTAMEAAGKEKMPGFQVGWYTMPFSKGEPINFWGYFTGQSRFLGEYGSLTSFDSETGALLSASDVREGPISDIILDAFRPLHYGNFGGLPIKILWCMAGLAPGLLAVTGFVMWWKRTRVAKRASAKRKSRALASVE